MPETNLTLTKDKTCINSIRFAKTLEDGTKFTIYVPNQLLGDDPKSVKELELAIKPVITPGKYTSVAKPPKI